MNQDEFEKIRRSQIFAMNKAKQEISDIRVNGFPKGISLGWKGFDNKLTIIKGQLNIMTGYSGSGKSEFMESIEIHMAKKENWNWFVYAPERFPLSYGIMQLCEKYTGKPIVDRYGSKAMPESDFMKAQEFISEHFIIYDDSSSEKDLNLNLLLDTIESSMKGGIGIDGVVIDPWNEIDVNQPTNMNETQWTGLCLQKIRKFARKYDLSFWILAHPTKPSKNKDGNYDAPSLYSISGSANWKNKADNGIIIHREDMGSNIVEVTVEKVKNRHYGKPGSAKFRFNYQNSCYSLEEALL